MTRATITDVVELETQVVEARRRGYAVSREEQSDGVASISAPVFAAGGHILAAVSIIGPSNRISDAMMAELRPMLVQAGLDISGMLGYEKSPGRSHAVSD
jgi:DNA-binding IclR family transcriptional regulator